MRAVIAIAGAALILILLGSLKLSVRASYRSGCFNLLLYIGPYSVKIPGRRKRGTNSGENSAEKNGKRHRFRFFPLVRAGYASLCRLVNRVQVERLCIHVVAADRDPANAAALYSGAALALDALKTIGEDNIQSSDLSASVDFEEDKTQITGEISLGIRAYLAVRIAAYFMLQYLHFLKKERTKNAGTSNQ